MAEGNLSRYAQLILQNKGFPLIHLHKCEDDLSSFSKALEWTVDHNYHGPFVTKRTPEELRESGAVAFLSRDKMAGIAVWPDGNIGAAFKDSRSRNRNAIGELVLTAIAAGGSKLDCYGEALGQIYMRFGFIPVAKVKFDWAYAPTNWRPEFKEPDVIFLMHCDDSVERVAQNIADYPTYTKEDFQKLPYFDHYEEAYRYRDNLQAKKR